MIFVKKPISCEQETLGRSLVEQTNVEDRRCQFNMPKVTGTLYDTLLTSSTFPIPIDRSETWVIQTFFAWLLTLIILEGSVFDRLSLIGDSTIP